MTGYRVYKREGRLKMPTKESFDGYAAARKFAYAWAAEQRRQGYRTGQVVIQGPLVFGEEVIWLGEPPEYSPAKAPRCHATKKSPTRLQREINEALSKSEPTPTSTSTSTSTPRIRLPPGQAAAWAHKYFSAANTPVELTELRRVMLNPWSGAGRYFATRTGIAQSEINTVYQQHQARLGGG